jgi:hypothetical protein
MNWSTMALKRTSPAVTLEHLLERGGDGADAPLGDLEIVGVAGRVVVRHRQSAALGEGAHVRAVDGRGGKRALDRAVLARLLEELADHFDGASVTELGEGPSRLLVRRHGDDLLQRGRSLVHVLLEHLFEGCEEGAEAVETIECFDAVVLGQMVREVDRVGVADEGSVTLITKHGERALRTNELETLFVHLEVLDQLLVTLEELFGCSLSAGPVGLLEDEDLLTSALELDSGGEAVVARAHDDYVILGHRYVPFSSAGLRTKVRGVGGESKGSV